MHAVTAETGLLEQPELLVGPGTLSGPGGVVGLVRTVPGPAWRRWLLGPTLAVYEAVQEPLVFTVCRRLALLPRWDVFDSEDELVGTVGGAWAVDRWEQPLLRLGPDGVFRSWQRRPLGRWDGRRLELGEEVRSEPFAKMLMLASVLR